MPCRPRTFVNIMPHGTRDVTRSSKSAETPVRRPRVTRPPILAGHALAWLLLHLAGGCNAPYASGEKTRAPVGEIGLAMTSPTDPSPSDSDESRKSIDFLLDIPRRRYGPGEPITISSEFRNQTDRENTIWKSG